MWNRGHRYRERLGQHAEGRSLIEYLSERYRHSSERQWRSRIEAGRVLVEGIPATSSRKLSAGEVLDWNRPPWREPPGPRSFALIHRDREVLGVAKPRGLPTMPGGGFLEKTLLHLVRERFPTASPLHRLGRGTSGIVLFSIEAGKRRHLVRLWQAGGVERGYRALVQGSAPPGETVLSQPIGSAPHPLLGSVAAVHPDGKRAVSRVRLLERRENSSLVEVAIETGRTHQIRIHLAAMGHPLIGDRLYPAGGIPLSREVTLPGDLGYWLHAHRVAFDGTELFCAPPPLLRRRGELSIR
ncbi:MAG TPA: RluA family pseudouridine synthase [Vicinamibacteria bacterium]|nr:RluA family pseudouridine synthase [Vicinamibacteria bacterium]